MEKEIKIWHISDTHTFHNQLNVPDNIDIVIFSGDCSNPKDVYINEREVREFIDWFKKLNYKYKIFVAGNHDCSIERNFVNRADFIENNIIYLEHESVEIEGLNIFGSPYTPTFGNWAFMKAREKIDRVWQIIPNNVDVLITHGPPKGVLDLSENKNHELEFCGCSALRKHVLDRIKPKLMCFGHIHNFQGILNAGIKQVVGFETIFSNGSCVEDGRFEKGIVNNGNLITITK